MLGLVALSALACGPGQPASPSAAAPKSQTQAAPADEPELPPVLSIERDPSDPRVYSVHVHAFADGIARVETHGPRPAEWLDGGPTLAGLKMQTGGPERVLRLRLGDAPASGAALAGAGADEAPPSVSVRYVDAQGNVLLSVDEPLPLPEGERAAAEATSGTAPRAIAGQSADGRPISSMVPETAPAPQVGEAHP